MTVVELAVMFTVLGILILVAEAFLPSHGILTVLGVGSLLFAVGCVFAVSWRAGALALVLMIVLAPVAVLLMLRVWPYTPMGRRLALPPAPVSGGQGGSTASPSVTGVAGLRVGQAGVTVTALRPTGVCEFGGERVEAVCDLGPLDPRVGVVIASMDGARPVVRPVGSTGPADGHVKGS